MVKLTSPPCVQELNLSSFHYSVVQDWIGKTSGKLNLLGFIKLLLGVTIPGANKKRH
jgi:hypothetical protein